MCSANFPKMSTINYFLFIYTYQKIIEMIRKEYRSVGIGHLDATKGREELSRDAGGK